MSKRIEALYDVTFRCTSKQLGTIMDTMKGFAHLVAVTQFTPPGMLTVTEGEIRGTITPIQRHTRQHRYAGGKQKKGIPGPELLKEIMRDGQPHDQEEIGTIYVSRGFARTSTSGYLSGAIRDGWVTRLADGRYITTSALRAQGAAG